MVATSVPEEDTLLEANRLKVVKFLGKALLAQPIMVIIQDRKEIVDAQYEQTTPHDKVTVCCNTSTIVF